MPEHSHEINQDILQKVYVVGPDTEAKQKMNDFLRNDCSLEPITKETAAAWMTSGAPFSEYMLNSIFEHAQIVIFLLTEEDTVCLRKDFDGRDNKHTNRESWLQPTQDQIFEAGYAFGRYHERVFLVRSGKVRLLSDVASRYIYDFKDPDYKKALKNRLQRIAAQVPEARKEEQGTSANEAEAARTDDVQKRKRVFVVFGRNSFILGEVRAFLRVIGLSPITWGEALAYSGKVAGPVGAILEAAFSQARAVVVLLTGDDLILPKNQKTEQVVNEASLASQPRANVIFEAGMAFGDSRLTDRTILVEFEFDTLKLGSNVADHHRLTLNNSTDRRYELIRRLRTAGCDVDLKDKKWYNTGNFHFTYKG